MLAAMRNAFLPSGQLAAACAAWTRIPLTATPPRRPLNLADTKAGWTQALSALTRFAGSAGYQTPQAFAAQAARENYGQWQQAGKQAHGLLVHGIDLGLSGDVLRPVYQEIVVLWRDAAGVAGVAAPISSRSADYPIGVTLLSLATLLDVQEAVPALVEQVLAFDTDQLLDYLSAGALELQEVSETLYHPHTYGALRPFFEQVTEALPEPLLPYLQTQYLEFFQRSPQQQKKGRPWLGTGYWALEVAALAVLYGWEDRALRSSPHYPADLVDYARGRLAQGGSGDA